MWMELRQLRYAVAVADAGHFGQAAQELHISPSGLSQQIRALERSLGVRLFVRDTRHVGLTPAGEAFLQHARVLVELADQATASARLTRKGKSGLIKIATNAAGLPGMMTDLLALYRERNPAVEVELHPGFSPQNLEALSRRRVDLALVALPFEPPELSSYLRLGSFEILVIVPARHRLATLEQIPRNEMARQSFVTIPRSVNPAVVDHIHESLFGGGPRPPLIEASDMAPTARISQVARDPGILGIAFGSEAALDARGVLFRHVEEPTPSIEYGLAWFAAQASPAVESFIATARELTELASVH
jgi:DNA-binding transcriptional LysR family regulator